MKIAEASGAYVPPGIENASRRDFLVGGAAALLLAGCGASGGGEPSGETRTVRDATGRSVEVPVLPQRIVALDPNRVISHLVELGVTPVGATSNLVTVGGDFSPLYGEEAQKIENVGVTGSPSLEEVSSLGPDLILHTVGYDDLRVETLSEIAPTVDYDAAEFSFNLARGLRFIAGIVNRRERAERIIAEFDSRMERLAPALDLAGRTFSLPAIELDQPGFTLYGPQMPLGRIVERLGGEVVPERVGDEVLEDYILDLSLERADLVDADFVLASRYFDKTGDADSNFSRVADSGVWNSVPAIKRGDVTVLDVQLTTGSYGFIGLGQVLDKLESELS